MITFWVVCVLLILVALIIILPSLLAKDVAEDLDRKKINRSIYEKKINELDQDFENDLIDIEQFGIAKSELQRSLLDDVADQKDRILKKNNKLLPFVIILIMPLMAILVYLKLNSGLVSLSPNFQKQMQADQVGQMQSVEQAIANLEQKLQQNPNDIEGWELLGRTYLTLERYSDSLNAYKRANELSNYANPALLVAYGEAQMFAAGQKFDQNIRSYFDKALEIDPNYEKGLWYAGLAAYQLEDYETSIKHWEKLMQRVPADKEQVKSALDIYLKDAKQKLGVDIASNEGEAVSTAKIDKDFKYEASITVNVSLNDAFHNKIENTDTLFIYARAVSGPRMPLALVKMTAGDLPTSVMLDDSVSMMPSLTLSSMDQVEVIARISKSGQAIMQSGDIFGSVQPVSTKKSETVDVIISELVP